MHKDKDGFAGKNPDPYTFCKKGEKMFDKGEKGCPLFERKTTRK